MNIALELARSGEGLKSGPLGLAVVLVLCVASYFLFKSMSKHLKKVREEFPADTQAPTAGSSAPSSDAPAATDAEPPAAHAAGMDDPSASA